METIRKKAFPTSIDFGAVRLILVKHQGPSNVNSSVKLCLLLLLLPVAVSCVMRSPHHAQYQTSVASTLGSQWPDEHKMLFEYHARDGHPALESDHVVLVFHGVMPKQQQVFHFQGKQQAVQIAGNGTSSVSVTCTIDRETVVFRSDYANGTNTLHFGQQTVQFSQGGRLLLAGDQTVDLSKGQKVVHLRRNTVTVE